MMFPSIPASAGRTGFVKSAICCMLIAFVLGAAPPGGEQAEPAASPWLVEAQRVNAALPGFWTSTVDDVHKAVRGVKTGTVEVVQ